MEGPGLAHALAEDAGFLVHEAAPLLIVGPRRARAAAFAALVFLQAAIAATGNYGFFNLLAVALCVPLLDDAMLPVRLRAQVSRNVA